MGVFNYSRFHYFDKNGHELMLTNKPNVRIKINNDYIPEFYAEYAFVNSTPDVDSPYYDPAKNSSLLQMKAGMRFNLPSDGSTLTVNTAINDVSTGENYIGNAFLRNKPIKTYNVHKYPSSLGIENYPEPIYNISQYDVRKRTLDKDNFAIDSSVNFFPTYTFNTRMEFEKVSTGLVETQTIFVLVEDEYEKDREGKTNFVTLKEYAGHYPEFVKLVEDIDASIGYIDASIANVDASISYIENELHDELAQIDQLNELIEQKQHELDALFEQIKIHYCSYGNEDPELTRQRRELQAEIDNLKQQIDVIYEDNEYLFTLLDDYNSLKNTLLKEKAELIDQLNDAKNKRDYFQGVVDYIKRFDLLFFIDCRDQKDFRFFNVEYDEMEWSDRVFINFDSSIRDGFNDNGYSVNVGFSGENDGVYEEKLYVCLLDRCLDEYIDNFKIIENPEFKAVILDAEDKVLWGIRHDGTETNINLDGIIIDGISAQIIVDNIIIQHDLRNPETDIKKVSIKTDDPGEAYPIGEIMLAAEAEGEDERYRTFFTNFGIPDPKYYDDIFIDSDINDDLPNYVSVNKNSKKLYLAYSEIFPYIGSYKALINAVKYLGYEDEIFFKEWYKEIGNSAMEDSGYTTFELSFGDNINKNTISNLELTERIHLRKMNWISMVYKINQEIDKSEDRFGFPTAITIYKNFNTERLVKLISLKKWLDKYAIGVNCHITDIGGEGLVFERYNLQKYGSFQKVIEYDNERAISAVLKDDVVTLHGIEDSIHADIDVEINTTDKDVFVYELEGKRFIDLCDGYFDSSCKYHDNSNDDIIDSSLFRYFGKCFDLNDNLNTFEVRTRGHHNSFRFSSDMFVKGIEWGPEYGPIQYDGNSPDLIVDNDEIFFDYNQCFTRFLNSAFAKSPVIQIENGIIKKYNDKKETTGEYDYYANIFPVVKDDVKYHRIEIVKDKLSNNPQTYDILELPTLLPPTYKRINETATDAQAYIKPISFVYDNISTKITRFDNYPYDSSSQYKMNKLNYGLRYCTDNINGIPCFKILGYEEKHLYFSDDKIRFPFTKESNTRNNGYEYMIEILNGRMIFNDPSNNSVITLNFVYDESENKQHIFVNTFKESSLSSMYEYGLNDDVVNRFLPNKKYNKFIEYYDRSADDCVHYNNVKKVSVHNIGEYTVDAILYDEFNNIFAKRSAKTIKVLPQNIDADVMTKNKTNSGYPYYKKGKIAVQSYLENLYRELSKSEDCIFEYIPKLQIKSVDDRLIKYNAFQTSYNGNNDTGTKSHINSHTNIKATFTSMSDRYEFVSNSVSVHDEKAYYLFDVVKKSGYEAHLGIYTKTMVQKITNIQDIDEALYTLINLDSSETSEGSKADVTIFVYDKICEYPVFSAPGVMLPYDAFDNTHSYDEYKLCISSDDNLGFMLQLILSSGNGTNCRYEYYIIPTWVIKSNITKISPKDNYIRMNLFDNPFTSYDFANYGISKDKMMTMFYKPSVVDYFGKGSYKLISASESNMRLYAYINDRKHTIGDDQSGIEGESWIGTSSMDYMKYIFDTIPEESDNQIGEIMLANNINYFENGMYVDKEYSISLRNFDTDYSLDLWEFDKDKYSTWSSIQNFKIYDVPVSIKNDDGLYVILVPYLPESDIYSINTLTSTVRWRLYKRIGDTKKNLIMEVFNKIFFVKLIESGMYDIELTIWDLYGNKYQKNMDGYIRVE